jgi:hypothetical protein
MHLLVRRVSPYTQHDLLLGVFPSADLANQARLEHLRAVLHSSEDPWARQAYREVSDADVEILADVPLLGISPETDRVFVVSSYSEGFGQVVRKFEAIAGTLDLAQARADSLVSEDDSVFPYECEVDEVPVGVLSRERDGYRTQRSYATDT